MFCNDNRQAFTMAKYRGLAMVKPQSLLHVAHIFKLPGLKLWSKSPKSKVKGQEQSLSFTSIFNSGLWTLDLILEIPVNLA